MKCEGYIYFLSVKVNGKEYIKIGQTINIKDRINTIQNIVPFLNITLIKKIYTENRFKVEFDLHKKFKKRNNSHEWYLFGEKDLAYIKSL